ncbi:mechanosensitive ion channel family protein [Marinobacter caseinilyticus]|uniref:mechanosensitive ion channel family protein n=1 Tax=Marinobacter caseinilyticus TaxID=2692195 RepID=UPI00140E5450|nr:mechanosensitive ion channel family protein [Marinobacter caseinilyticus]
MDGTFFTDVWNQVQKNITDSSDALGLSQVEWYALAAHAMGQLVVSALLLAFFGLLYLCLNKTVLLATRRLQSAHIGPGHLQTGLRYLFLLFTTLAIMAQYDVPDTVLKATARAGFVALGFYLAWLACSKILKEGLNRYQIDKSIGQLLKNMLSVLMTVFAAVMVLSQFGFDVFSIIAGLGIVGIAVGFAAQSTLSNFIAGVTLLIERPFRIGDWVKINDQEGKVIKIALRTTWLRTRDNIFTMIPNDSVASSDIVNYSAEGPIRVRLPLGIAYKESARQARDIIMPVLLEHPKIIQSSDMVPMVRMTGLGDSSVDLVALAWISPEDIDFQPGISAELYESIKEALDTAGIEIPFPHLQLFIDDAKGLKPLFEPLYSTRNASSTAPDTR